MNFDPGFSTRLPATADLLDRGNFVVHPTIRQVVLHGSRGPANRPRPDSDVDLSLIACHPSKDGGLYREAIDLTLHAWRGAADLDLAVVFDTRSCGLTCFDHQDWTPGVCTRGGLDCFGLYKTQKGFHGFVDNAGVEVRRMYPCAVVWRAPVPAVRGDIVRTPRIRIRPHTPADQPAILEVYRSCEDFLSLGPVATASMRMVLEDIAHARDAGGVYCCILDASGAVVGVLDFVPAARASTACLSLLMIAGPYRRRGYGAEVLAALEAYLARRYGTQHIEGGVQVNNPAAIRFWREMGFTIESAALPQPDGTVAHALRKQLGHASEVG